MVLIFCGIIFLVLFFCSFNFVYGFNFFVNKKQIGNIENGDYRLSVRGKGGVDFESSSQLKFEKKSYTVFIQTDKAVYKPGHKVLFRAIVLNAHLKPAAEVRNEPLNIFISVSIFLESSNQEILIKEKNVVTYYFIRKGRPKQQSKRMERSHSNERSLHGGITTQQESRFGKLEYLCNDSRADIQQNR